MSGEVYDIAGDKASIIHVLRVHEEYTTLVMHTAINIVEGVDGRVELVMAAHSRKYELARLQIVVGQIDDSEVGLAGMRI